MSFWVKETIYIYMCESPPFLFYSTPYFLLPLLIWSGASPKIKKVSFSGSHSPSTCSSGTFTSLFCNEFRVSVVTILKSSSLGATEGIGKEWQFCCLNFRNFFFTDPKYLKSKFRDNTFRVKCNPVLQSPCFFLSFFFLSFSLWKMSGKLGDNLYVLYILPRCFYSILLI